MKQVSHRLLALEQEQQEGGKAGSEILAFRALRANELKPRSKRSSARLLVQSKSSRLPAFLLSRARSRLPGEDRDQFLPRVEGQKVSEGLMARRAIRRATEPPDRLRQRVPPLLAFCPSDLPVKNLDRTRWP
jgi:hypothetical protein